MQEQVEEFFRRFEIANASSDVDGIGELYADTFMFAGPNGVQSVKKEDFLKFVPKMKSHFESLGLSNTVLRTVEESPLDAKYLLAKVGWRMTLRGPAGSREIDSAASYILARGVGDRLTIICQIDHQDLASVIRTQQEQPS